MTRRPLLLSALLIVTALSCGQDDVSGVCTTIAAAGLSVHVTDAVTAQPLCDATVTAVDGSYTERLFQTSCGYHVGAFERPGTYVVQAERPGFAPKAVPGVQVVMETGRCPHVREVQLEIALSPGP
jgi:hypothetical protein